MRKQKFLRTISFVLIAVTLLSSLAVLGVSAAVCTHSTEKRLVHNSGGFTIANVCKTCGEIVSVVGHVDSSKTIKTYKEATYSQEYTVKNLNTGFGPARGDAVYVDDNVISKGGEPYWLIFDMSVGALPNLESGNAANNADRAGVADVFTRCLLAVGQLNSVYHNVQDLARIDLRAVYSFLSHIKALQNITSKYYFILIQNNYTLFFSSCKDFFAYLHTSFEISIAYLCEL